MAQITGEKSRRLLTTMQGAGYLGVGRTTMWSLINKGEVETVTIGRSRRILIESLDNYVERLRAQG